MRRIAASLIVAPMFPLMSSTSALATTTTAPYELRPCSDVTTPRQISGCETLRLAAAERGIVLTEGTDVDPGTCGGGNWATRTSKLFGLVYLYTGRMHVSCQWDVQMCMVAMYSAVSLPGVSLGIGGEDGSYCEANSITSYGITFNQTAVESFCIANGRIWYNPNPQIKTWT